MRQAKSTWRHSNNTETWHGEAATRGEIIKEGTSYYCGEPFYVALCTPNKLFDTLFDDIADTLNDLFDGNDLCFEDVFSEETGLTPEECQEFENTLNEAWRAWAEKIGLPDRVLALRTSHEELIKPTPSE